MAEGVCYIQTGDTTGGRAEMGSAGDGMIISGSACRIGGMPGSPVYVASRFKGEEGTMF